MFGSKEYWKRFRTKVSFEGDGNGAGGGAGSADPPNTIKIGEKEYTAEQITALEQHAEAGAKLNELAGRYGIAPEQYLQFTDNSLGIVSDLQSKGFIDEEGNLKLPDKASPPKAQPTVTPPAGNDAVANALAAIEKMNERFSALEAGINNLYKGRVTDTLRAAHPGFTDEDIVFCAREASRTKRPVLEIAKERAKSKESSEGQLRESILKDIAKTYNLDFAQLNKIKELGADGGITPAKVTGGKPISMRGGKDAISPKKALLDYLEAKQQVS